MTAKGSRVIGHLETKDVLPGPVGGPSVLTAAAKVHVLTVEHDVSFPRVQAPHEDHFVFAAATVRTNQTIVHGLAVGKTKFEGDSLFGNTNRLALILDRIVNKVRNEGKRHPAVIFWSCF